jgi:hypothetical protein
MGYLSRYSGGLRFDSWEGQKLLLFPTASGPALDPTQPTIHWVTGVMSTGVKRPGRKADHSPSYNSEVKDGGTIPPLPYKY